MASGRTLLKKAKFLERVFSDQGRDTYGQYRVFERKVRQGENVYSPPNRQGIEKIGREIEHERDYVEQGGNAFWNRGRKSGDIQQNCRRRPREEKKIVYRRRLANPKFTQEKDRGGLQRSRGDWRE